jgi:rubrerythrin
MQRFEKIISELLPRPEFHARFANTFSLLEYLGARKILKSQKSESISSELLAHISEEIRHAQILKRLALRLSTGKLDSYRDEHLLCGREARNYLQTIDEAGAKQLGLRGQKENYLLTTLLIEERASIIYPVYKRLLNDANIPNAIGAIVRDENTHLVAVHSQWMTSVGLPSAELAPLRDVEQDCFESFLGAIEDSWHIRTKLYS